MSKQLMIILKSTSSENSDRFYSEFKNQDDLEIVMINPVEQLPVDLKILKRKLENPDAYNGLVLINLRATNVLKDLAEFKKTWPSKPAFCLGASIADCMKPLAAQVKTFTNVRSLTTVLKETGVDKSRKPLLLITGSIVPVVITNALDSAGISYENVEIFECSASDKLKTYIAQFTDKKLDYVVVFSPSSATDFISLAREHKLDVEETQFFTIGTSITQALIKSGIPPQSVHQSELPLPDSVLEAFLQSTKLHKTDTTENDDVDIGTDENI